LGIQFAAIFVYLFYKPNFFTMQAFQSLSKTAVQRKNATAQHSENQAYNPFLGNKTASQNPFLANQAIQREENKAATPENKTATPEKKSDESAKEDKGTFGFEEWLTGSVYDLMKKELGEDKIKGYAGQIAEQLNGVLNEQMKKVTTPDNTLTEDQIKEISKSLNGAVKKGVEELLLSPEGKQFKEVLLKKVKTDPGVALGMVLIGLAAFYLSNSEIPKINKDFKIGDKSSIGVSAELGKIQTPQIKNLGSVFKYSGEQFRTEVSATYKDQGEKKGKELSGKGKISIGKEDDKKEKHTRFDTELGLSTNLANKHSFNISPHLFTPSFNLGLGFDYGLETPKEEGGESKNTFAGSALLGIGETYKLNSKLIMMPDGNLSLDLNQLIQFSKFLSMKNGFEWNDSKDDWKLSGGLTFDNKEGASFAPVFGFNSDNTLSLGFTGGYKKDGFNIIGKADYQNQTPNKDNAQVFDPSKFTASADLGYQRVFDQQHQVNLGVTGKAEALGGTFGTVGLGLEAKYTYLRRQTKEGKTEYVPFIEFGVNGNYDRKPFGAEGMEGMNIFNQEGMFSGTIRIILP
jgi:hypothetical protein